jgi:hypothetical protein
MFTRSGVCISLSVCLSDSVNVTIAYYGETYNKCIGIVRDTSFCNFQVRFIKQKVWSLITFPLRFFPFQKLWLTPPNSFYRFLIFLPGSTISSNRGPRARALSPPPKIHPSMTWSMVKVDITPKHNLIAIRCRSYRVKNSQKCLNWLLISIHHLRLVHLKINKPAGLESISASIFPPRGLQLGLLSSFISKQHLLSSNIILQSIISPQNKVNIFLLLCSKKSDTF